MPPSRLLIRLGSMGDVVLTTAAANALRDRHGDHSVDVLVKEEWAPLWENHPAVHEVLPWPRHERGIPGILAWAKRLRARRYAEVIDLQSSPRSRMVGVLAGWSGIRRPERHGTRRRLLARFKRWGPPVDFQVRRTFVEAAVAGGEGLPSLHPGPETIGRAEVLVPRPGVVGLVPGARHRTKRWPLDRFVEVGRRLGSTVDDPLPVFFGPDEDSLLEMWKTFWPVDGTWTPIMEPLTVVAACMARMRTIVSNDTGLMHVAAAVGTPVVAIFGPTVRSFGFFPAGDGHRLLEVPELTCRPCNIHGGSHCPKGHFRCMLDLNPDLVLAAMARPDPEPLSTRTS